MGKSDPTVFSFYADVLDQKNQYESIGFFGFSNSNVFTDWFNSKSKNYYDRTLKNWDINTFPYEVKEKFDLIVCTRVAYFSRNPKEMLSNFKRCLTSGGKILVDWGLGDHWRFQDFAIGWNHHGYQEFAYDEKNYLWSCYLSENLKENRYYCLFGDFCKGFGYESVETAIRDEVETIITDEEIRELGYAIDEERCLALWPAAPQLYVCLLLSKL